MSTGQTITIPPGRGTSDGATSLECELFGLHMSSGDELMVTIHGIVE